MRFGFKKGVSASGESKIGLAECRTRVKMEVGSIFMAGSEIKILRSYFAHLNRRDAG